MGCNSHEIRDAAGNIVGVAHVCSRGRRGKPCKSCGAPGTRQCDAPLFGAKAGKTCDAWMCERCATRTGPNTDLCPAHASEARRRAAADAWLSGVMADETEVDDIAAKERLRAGDAPCASCRGTEWVCERHPDRPWEGDAVPGCCACGAPGMKCPACDPDAVDRVALEKMFPRWDESPQRVLLPDCAQTAGTVGANGAPGGTRSPMSVPYDRDERAWRAEWEEVADACAHPVIEPTGGGMGRCARCGDDTFVIDSREAEAEREPSWMRERDERAAAAHAQPIAAKVAHVRRAGQTRGHTCHWPGCGRQVPPAMWGCGEHWRALPRRLKDAIWREYRVGQEENMSPSHAYLDVAREVDEWIRNEIARTGGR